MSLFKHFTTQIQRLIIYLKFQTKKNYKFIDQRLNNSLINKYLFFFMQICIYNEFTLIL